MARHATLHICTSCGPAAGAETLRRSISDAGLAPLVRVCGADCLGPCEAPVVLTLQGEGRATYLFSRLDLPGDLDDVVATCRTYLAIPDGWIEDARRCGRLRHCLRARIPARRAAPDGR